MTTNTIHFTPRPIIIGAVILALIALYVLINWHIPQIAPSLNPYITLMAYNTALSFMLCSAGLSLLLTHTTLPGILCSITLLLLNIIRIIEILFSINLGTETWYVPLIMDKTITLIPTSSITAISFIFSSISLLLLQFRPVTPNRILVSTFIASSIAAVAIAVLIGHALNLFPDSVWAGRKMSPQTALCFLLFSVIIVFCLKDQIISSFSKLNFFSRLTIGFLFSGFLLAGIGFIAILQINSVAAISQKLYQEPLQKNNAAIRIKESIGNFNRTIKNIAINPDLATTNGHIEQFLKTSKEIATEISIIEEIDKNNDKTKKLKAKVNQWESTTKTALQNPALSSQSQLKKDTVFKIQGMALEVDAVCDEVIGQAQNEIKNLNEESLKTKDYAGKIMLAVISSFLAIGALTSRLITINLNTQLCKIRAAMLDIANGNTSVSIPFSDYPHEVGDMARTLKVFASNINEQKKTAALLLHHQGDLEKANRKLAQTNKDLETFAYVASHDLKSPLRGIAQLSSWIEEDLDEKQFSEVTKHTTMLRNRIQRMEKLLDDLLTFYRAGKTDGNLVQVNVAHMAKELFDIQNTKPGLRLELAENLPCFTTLSTPFEQVLRNLFSNAIKHHDLEQGMIRLSCTTLPNQFYRFSVCDDGPGIPEKFQQRVFGMFQTLKPRDELEGSGMGLALIKKIVDTYGGTITLESEGRGCCFHFSWPQHITKDQKND